MTFAPLLFLALTLVEAHPSNVLAPTQSAADPECSRILRSDDGEMAGIIEQNPQLLAATCYGIALGGRDVVGPENPRILAACRASFRGAVNGVTGEQMTASLNQNLANLRLSPVQQLYAIRLCESYAVGMRAGLRDARGIFD